MNIHALLLAAVIAATSFPASAQKLRVKDANFDALKGTTQLNVKYEYHDMTVSTKNLSEQAFIDDKKGDLNKKEAGRGDTWAASWVRDREARFEPQFKEEFEKQSDMKLGNFPDAK